jgi:methylglutaconyl-CoA hydratase
MNSPVNLSLSNGVANLILNRPDKHNAFDDEVIARLLEALNAVRSNPEARVLVLQSTGKSFSAGADLTWMKRMAKLSHHENLADARQLASLMQTLDSLPIPTIAKVQGAAYGGAIGLISCCDIAIASHEANFCLSEVKLGLSPATISPFVIKAMGARRCRQLFLTAEVFSAKQAAEWELIHTLVSTDELDSAVDQTVAQILKTGPKASIATKQLIADVLSQQSDIAEHTAQLIAGLRVSEEGQAGLAAFFDKQLPPWVESRTK